MATSSIIKSTPHQAVIKILGPGTATIDLESLKTAYENFDRGNTKVNINTIYFSSNNFVTVVRNSATVLKLSSDTENWVFNAASGFVLDEQNGSNVEITFVGSGDGTVILGLSKVAGYTPNTLTSIGYDITQETSLRS